MPANFSPPVCSPTEEAGKSKNKETGFIKCSLYTNSHYLKQWVAKDKISIYIPEANFIKIHSF
jgi:hypothetical protein